MTRDANTLAMMLGAPAAKPRAPRKPTPKFAIGMDVIYCGKPAQIVGKNGRTWMVSCEGNVWGSRGKDMIPD